MLKTTILPLLRLLRAGNLVFIALFQILVRYCIVLPILAGYGIEPQLSTLRFAMLVFATTALAASGNVINDYFDIMSDKINRPDRVIVGRHIDRRTTMLIHVILTLIGTFLGMYIAFVYRKETYALLFLAVPAILWFYSTHFKKQMLIGNMVVALLTSLTAYLIVSAEITAIAAVSGPAIIDTPACSTAWFYTSGFAFFAFLTNLTREIIKDMEDAEGDQSCGCHTLPIEMGIGYSKSIVVLLDAFLIAVMWAAYITSDYLSSSIGLGVYITALITLPTIYVCYKVIKAKTSADFHTASTVSKLIMLAGVLTMFFFVQ